MLCCSHRRQHALRRRDDEREEVRASEKLSVASLFSGQWIFIEKYGGDMKIEGDEI